MNLLSLFKTDYSHDKLENMHIHLGTDLDNLDDAINGLARKADKDGMVHITEEKAQEIRKSYDRLSKRWYRSYVPRYEEHDKQMAPVNTAIMLGKMIFLLVSLLGIIKIAHTYGLFDT